MTNIRTTGPRDAAASSTAAAPREVELKLRIVDPSAIAALKAHPALERHAVGPWRATRLHDRYFDTADRALGARGLGLRLRRSGRRWAQTLKSGERGGERALSSRGEWEMPVDGPRLVLARFADTPLSDVASARTLARRLVVAFTTDVRRESRVVALDDGTRIEIAIDVGTIAAGRGSARRTRPIREVELELAEGDTNALMRFARRLVDGDPALALLPLRASKARRGYRLADRVDDAPVRVELPDAVDGDDARAIAGRVIGACSAAAADNVDALLDALERGEAFDAIDTGYVHQARVAGRRLRSALRLFGPVIGRKRADALDGPWREIGHALGAVRDLDVFVASLVDDEPDLRDGEGAAFGPALASLDRAARARRGDVARALVDFVASPAMAQGLLAADRLSLRLADGSRSRPFGPFVARRLASQEALVRKGLRRIAALDDEERHQARIEAKRLRYGLDLVVDEERRGDYADALADIQKKLGALNDTVNARALAASLVAGDDGAALAAGYDTLLERRKRKQLPKVAALGVRLEMGARPWTDDGAIPRPEAASGDA